MYSIKNYYWLILLLSCCSNSLAQTTCTQDDLLNKIGTWKKNEDYLSPGKNYTETIKPEIVKRLDKIQQIIHEAYPQPKGMEVKWKHQIYGTPPFKSGTVTYSFWAQLFEYGCDAITHKPVLYDESDDDIYVFVNHFDRFVLYDTSMRVGNLYVALMFPRVGKLKDVDLFQISLVRGDERFIIISHDGQLPYTPLTQKQYLAALKRKLQNEENSILDRSLKAAKNDEQKSNAEKYWTSHYDPKIKLIDDYLSKTSEEELNQVALVKDMMDFKKFYSEKEGGRMPVILNTNYFNSKQPPYWPQFLLVYWTWNDGEGPAGGLLRPVAPDMNVCCPVSKYFKESMEQNLDVNALRQLLNK
ncbi:MAG: hypothetical protein Q8941_16790 [Bacteroidota bacterium]|nr:hypothetical protein [Bacteroidota bacterium]